MANFNVVFIPMLTDSYQNHCYYVYKDDINSGLFVDPAEPHVVDQFRKDFGITGPIQTILTTHWHGDHSGGNLQIKKDHKDVAILGGAVDNVPGCTHPLSGGEKINLFKNEVKMTCYHTPCHTKGHICYYLETNGCQDGVEHEIAVKGKYMLVSNVNRCVFTGDTLFIGGCGFFMEGTAAEMLKAMDTINTLPDDTKVFVGHEYTLKNMEFGMKAEGQTNPNIPKA